MTLETKTFFGVTTGALRAAACRGAALRAGFSALTAFFFAGADVRLLGSFFAAVRGDAFCALRTGSFDDVFAFVRAGLAFKVRPLTDDLVADRRVGVRDVERLSPFVMGLLMCGEAFNLKDAIPPSVYP